MIMCTMEKKGIGTILFWLSVLSLFAQQSDNYFIRNGYRLKKPAVFSYGPPWGSYINPNQGYTDPNYMNFDKVGLSVANLVDMVNPQKFAPWQDNGHCILSRQHLLKGAVSSDEIVAKWKVSLDKKGIDGLAFDEFSPQSATNENIQLYTKAIKQIRQLYPDKILLFWCTNLTTKHVELVRCLNEYADFIAIEIYYKATDSPTFLVEPKPFPRFTELVGRYESMSPGIISKILIGLGTVQNSNWAYDNSDSVDYSEFLVKQVETCARNSLLARTAGLAIYMPGYLFPSTLEKLNEAIRKEYHIDEQEKPRK
jgi:hypothetical protein